MDVSSLSPGCYRRIQGVCIVEQGEHTVAITAYPLRVMRLPTSMARILALCATQQTCEQLAQKLSMPIKRVEALCDQLRWKNLLEAGALLPPLQWPGVSIIVPSYNRVSMLERCLQSLFALNYPLDCLEIIVVDDGSTDMTPTRLQELSSRYPQLRVVTHHNRQGVGISRNSGAAAARHALLAYIDSDCVATPQWLTQLVPAFHNQRIAAVGGMIRAYDRQSVLGRYEDVRSSLFMGEHSQQVRPAGPLTYLPTANLLIRRDMWQQLGGFAALQQGEDVDFCRRLLATGASMLYLPHGVVYHDYRVELSSFLGIRAAYASAEAALLRRHPTERRILLLPPEQAAFTIAMLSALWAMLRLLFLLLLKGRARAGRVHACVALFSLLFAAILTVGGTHNRLQKVRAQQVPISAITVLKATVRGHLAYMYHCCRHIARYYTLPMLIIGVLLPPLLLLPLLLGLLVAMIDYVRLKPAMSFAAYACCAVLDDCAYEVGVVQGCIRHKTWKPLVPVLRKRL